MKLAGAGLLAYVALVIILESTLGLRQPEFEDSMVIPMTASSGDLRALSSEGTSAVDASTPAPTTSPFLATRKSMPVFRARSGTESGSRS